MDEKAVLLIWIDNLEDGTAPDWYDAERLDGFLVITIHLPLFLRFLEYLRKVLLSSDSAAFLCTKANFALSQEMVQRVRYMPISEDVDRHAIDFSKMTLASLYDAAADERIYRYQAVEEKARQFGRERIVQEHCMLAKNGFPSKAMALLPIAAEKTFWLQTFLFDDYRRLEGWIHFNPYWEEADSLYETHDEFLQDAARDYGRAMFWVNNLTIEVRALLDRKMPAVQLSVVHGSHTYGHSAPFNFIDFYEKLFKILAAPILEAQQKTLNQKLFDE